MDMKKFLTFLTITFVLTLTFSMWGFQFGQDVAVADDTISYVYVAPADLKNNEYAGQSTVEVKDNDSGDTLFYLIESYYYPVKKTVALGTTYYSLQIEGTNAVIVDGTNIIDALPQNATEENALPSNLLLKDGITFSIGEHNIDTRNGWTVKLIGVNGDDFFVQASKDDVVVCGLSAKSNFTSSNVAYHPIDLAKREGLIGATPDGEVDGDKGSNKSLILRIVLIIGIAIPAIIIAIMIFKPGRASARTNYDRHAMRTRREEEIDYDRDRSYDRERDYSRRASYDDRDYRDRYERDRDDRRDDRNRRDDRYDDRGYDRGYDNRGYDNRGYDDRGYDDRNGRR